MSPGQDGTRYFIYTLWLYSLSTLNNIDENKIFFCSLTTSTLAMLSTRCFELPGDISFSLLVNPSHADGSWEWRNMCLWIYTLWIYSLGTLENTDENKLFFCLFTTRVLSKLSNRCFEHSGVMSCSLLVDTSHTDESFIDRTKHVSVDDLQKTSIKINVTTDEGKESKQNVTLNKRWNWSSCAKLALSASWTHGLIAQSVRASERNSVVVGSNPTQTNFL